MILANAVTLKAEAKLQLLFRKPTSKAYRLISSLREPEVGFEP